ncbi:Nif-specific regulatory protein [Candidatus Propionivibrio aalborgensis]|uniref:Nif-specific regulatory protein n=1 Tax=Candidatus Propionivibrio aalborgensis TaxID=1860101 RepID=A0A1A8XHF0_9RHOO|nr:nif-specific transcriptional activator NifA [Candidatus Propionivibrio aalborgensis]SBT04609.1 Nif-specific regulatory protein [Candidatus Propionivibrio aalborgensis]HRC60396.1 nif-specific transcriptional activator NifA [Candidatus Propionivibrio aalborgensis]
MSELTLPSADAMPNCGYCRTHELNIMLLAALYAVSRVLSRSLAFNESLRDVLRILHDEAGLTCGLISVVDQPTGNLTAHVLHHPAVIGNVQYQPGEGILGLMLEKPRTVMLSRIADEPRFLNRLDIYQQELPFIAAPIRVGGNLQGILAVQPGSPDDGLLEERTQFVEMVANLIGQSLRLSLEVEQEKSTLVQERDLLRRTVRHQFGFDSMVGRSATMRRVFDQARLVAKWDTTVLIRGETGTGKELIANAIHYNSARARNTMVKLNCAALPENLLESELFGHERGAFTGAVEARKGRFEQAHGGTLFLDEIGDVSSAFQAKLLRILQEGEFERVGGNRTIKVDVRFIAATHRDLETAVEMGDFREDLFYRLNVMPLFLPPLRERIEDIPEIARHLLGKIGSRQKRKLNLTDMAQRRLVSHSWPGNVRELENCLERAAVLAEDGQLDVDLIRFPSTRERTTHRPLRSLPSAATGMGSSSNSEFDIDDPDLSEKERVIAALEQAGWVQAKAARILGMTPRQIAYRIQTLNIEVKQF